MRLRFEPPRPWTKAHAKFCAAWVALQDARALAGELPHGDPATWIYRRWRVHTVRELSPAQARAGCRQLNCWRASIEGRVSVMREYPRQARRNFRRALLHTMSPSDGNFLEFKRRVNERVAAMFSAPAARNTAGAGFDVTALIEAAAPAGRLMPTDSGAFQ